MKNGRGRILKDDRPICINYGCKKYCTTSNPGRFRPFCARCHQAGFTYRYRSYRTMADGSTKIYIAPPVQLAEGVTPFKTGKCSNQKHGQKGYLGFPCPMNYKKAPWAIGLTDLDHKDGDHTNNKIKNIQELCKLCHLEKSRRCGDYKDQNNYKKYTNENGELRYYKLEKKSRSVLPI